MERPPARRNRIGQALIFRFLAGPSQIGQAPFSVQFQSCDVLPAVGKERPDSNLALSGRSTCIYGSWRCLSNSNGARPKLLGNVPVQIY